MAEFDMIDRIIAREGGDKITRDPNDPGGVTKYGISQKSHPDIDIEALTYEAAKDIYIKEYYLGANIYLLPKSLQEMVMDFCVHSGRSNAVPFLQKVVGAKQDGIIGEETVATISKYPLEDIAKAYTRERVIFLAKQTVAFPNKLKYLVGWLNRVLTINV